MSHEHLLCLDIETVPDRDLVPADWPTDEFIRKPIWHRVVAISFVEARIEQPQDGGERYVVECCRSGGEAGWDEGRLLQAYWKHFAKRRARIVTWNGKGFDLPVLRLRAMMHGIPAEALGVLHPALRAGLALRPHGATRRLRRLGEARDG